MSGFLSALPAQPGFTVLNCGCEAHSAGYRLVGGGKIKQGGALVQHHPEAALTFHLDHGELQGISSSRIAMARVQPAEAPRILTGKQTMVKP
jgi:hypothetical protein